MGVSGPAKAGCCALGSIRLVGGRCIRSSSAVNGVYVPRRGRSSVGITVATAGGVESGVGIASVSTMTSLRRTMDLSAGPIVIPVAIAYSMPKMSPDSVGIAPRGLDMGLSRGRARRFIMGIDENSAGPNGSCRMKDLATDPRGMEVANPGALVGGVSGMGTSVRLSKGARSFARSMGLAVVSGGRRMLASSRVGSLQVRGGTGMAIATGL